jgi:hypothetical protein
MNRIAAILDDATSLLAIQKQMRINQDFPMISQLENQGREYGICIWAAVQEPGLVLSSAKNVNVRIMMPLSSCYDCENMGRSMGLDGEEMIRAKNLETGEAIIKIGTRPVGPMLIQLERSKIDRNITVEQARQQSETIRKKLLSFVKLRSDKLKEILIVESRSRKKKEDMDSYLIKADESQGLMISEVREKYKFTTSRESNLRKQAIDMGYVEEVEVDVNGRGNNPKILRITEKGKDRLLALGIKQRHKGRGSPEHRFWQLRGKEYLQKVLGCRADIEKTIGETAFDVFGIGSDNRTVAIEIAMTPDYELVNIAKGVKNTDRLITACRSSQMKENLKIKAAEELGSEIASQVEFIEVKDLYLSRSKNG